MNTYTYMEGHKPRHDQPRRNELQVSESVQHEAVEAIRAGKVTTDGAMHLIHSSHSERVLGVSTTKEGMIVLTTIEQNGAMYYVGVPRG